MLSSADLKQLTNLYNQGRIDAALTFGQSLLESHPDDASLHNMVGVLCARLDRLDDALAHYDKALSLRDPYAEAFNNRGNVLVRQGRHEDAIANFRSSIAAMPGYAVAHNGLANALHLVGKPQEAAASALEALRLQPNYAEAHNNYGNALLDLGRANEAAQAFGMARRLDPALLQAGAGLGKALSTLGYHRQAADCLREVLHSQPDSASWHNELGNILSDLNEPEQAEEHYRRALEIEPDQAEIYSNLAIALGDAGRFDEARACLENALQKNASFCEAHYNLSVITTFAAGDKQIAAMQELAEDSRLADEERCYLCFALGKACEDLGEVDRSFEYYAEGNRLRKAVLGYHIEADAEQFEQIRSAYGEARLDADNQSADTRPVFIVGLPRSGTSLVEQILASHSSVYGAGELDFASRILLPMVRSASEAGTAVDKEGLAAFRREYLDELRFTAPDAAVVTDKMPGNFRWIGFLLAALPEAHIIHVRRDPMACCWSMYKRVFQKNGFTNDLEDLGKYCLLYNELMAFWSKMWPSRIYDLDYARLTEQPESETRRLLEFCDLPWEDDCLEFHATKRAVRTASGAQVRRKMYTGSSEAWRKYAAHLEPLQTVLAGPQ